MPRQESFDDHAPNMKLEESERQQLISESQYGQHDLDEVVIMLTEVSTLEEQGDIIHFLVKSYGLDQRITLQKVRRKKS